MNKNPGIMVPYLPDQKYLSYIADANIIYSRYKDDYLCNYALYKHAEKNCLTEAEVKKLQTSGRSKLCYAYEIMDFENREFTDKGYSAIRKDIDRIIKDGFSYILVANTYLVELLTNEYPNDIDIIISSQLEFNSQRAKIFFEVLNNIGNIKYIIASQHRLSKKRLLDLQSMYEHINIIIEADRWASDILMIQEYYYNVVFGYYSLDAVKALKDIVKNNLYIPHVKKAAELIYNDQCIIKFGELGVKSKTCINNIRNFTNNNQEDLCCIDFELWDTTKT